MPNNSSLINHAAAVINGNSIPSHLQQETAEEQLIINVLNSFESCSDPRLKLLLQALVRNLHGFVREVRLTEAEWSKAIDFLRPSAT